MTTTTGAPTPPDAARPDSAWGLSTPDAVRSRYARLYTAATGTTAGWAGGDRPLPPYLCRLLNRAEPLGQAAAAPHAVLGTAADPLVAVGTGPLRLRYATGIAPHLLKAVGLTEVRAVTPGPKTTARLTAAADTLPGLLPEAAAVVARYLTALVLLKPAGTRLPAGPTGTMTASCTFTGLPFTAFLSGLGLHHMVPSFMFSQPSVYTLQESLYHEALRLALNEEQRLVAHFDSPESRDAVVYVSWERDWRTAGECLHMLYVYVHLARLRMAALRLGTGPKEPVLGEALRSVLGCAQELANSLGGMRYLFSEAGLELLDYAEGLLPPGEMESSG
ncbi:hypothetical protein [Streptomyces boninensis]|uniref:hypothetical protein n=1 Tax=Streptomyces boninensis TaxID=2039455 RepID=UPI003B2147F6